MDQNRDVDDVDRVRTIAFSAQESKTAVDQSKPAAGTPVADDNMTPYRNLAADTLRPFQAHDMPTAKNEGTGA